MSWGSQGWGITPWGGVSGTSVTMLSLVSVVAIRENCVQLAFSDDVYFSRWHDPPDASFVSRYAITPLLGSIGDDGQPARPVAPVLVDNVFGDGTLINIWLDRPMSPYAAQYLVTVTDLASVGGAALDPTASSFEVFGVQRGLPAHVTEQLISNRDIANPQTLTALKGLVRDPNLLGRFVVDETGDLGTDQGLVSYKKRVFRRLITQKGRFAHLPNYGTQFLQSVKQLARPQLVHHLATDAEAQIRQEPETADVSVQIVLLDAAQGLYVYRIRASMTAGTAANFDVPVMIGG